MKQELIFKKLSQARKVADIKWGNNTGSLQWKEDPYLAMTVLIEEVGEVARAIQEQNSPQVVSELLDVGQVVIAFLEALPNPSCASCLGSGIFGGPGSYYDSLGKGKPCGDCYQ